MKDGRDARAFLSPNHVGTAALGCPGERNSAAPATSQERILTLWTRKRSNPPKLTANFLIWITAFVLLLFGLIAHFVWRIF